APRGARETALDEGRGANSPVRYGELGDAELAARDRTVFGVCPKETLAARPHSQGACGRMATATPWITGLGQVRRSQVLSTYAIGAIVDLERGSFMPLG